ncbi:MAG: hypothetical protein ACI8UR_000611 [Natronomonas sp.]|jgi:hypothetical protein|uniref:hypothetical protein n=1 Tax=Natronomonas sp. TaxID=2184060 RepID=UPI0039E5CD25
MTDETEYDNVPVACTLPKAERENRRDWVETTLTTELTDIEEREDGYEFVFRGTEEVFEAVSTFVKREAECCSFARFRIEVPQAFETVRLQFDGPDGTKQLLEEGLVAELR